MKLNKLYVFVALVAGAVFGASMLIPQAQAQVRGGGIRGGGEKPVAERKVTDGAVVDALMSEKTSARLAEFERELFKLQQEPGGWIKLLPPDTGYIDELNQMEKFTKASSMDILGGDGEPLDASCCTMEPMGGEMTAAAAKYIRICWKQKKKRVCVTIERE
jgi:hypothetical protein